MHAKVKVRNRMGIHNDVAKMFIMLSTKFKCEIWVEDVYGHRVNAKSLLGVVILDIRCGNEIKIITYGTNEDLALETLLNFIDWGCTLESYNELTEKIQKKL